MKDAVKGLVEKAAVGSGLPHLARRIGRSRAVILAYHNVVPDDLAPCGDAGLHVPRSRFAAHLDLLERHCRVVSLSEALGLLWGEDRAGRPVVAITFDDAYRGAVTTAVEELSRRGMPATIFVAPFYLGRASFWWDALAGPGPGGLDSEVRSIALSRCAGREEEVLSWARSSDLDAWEVPPALRPATESELESAAGLDGVSLGSHSWSHPDLTRIDDARLEEELARPLEWLRDRFGPRAGSLAYPYGRHDARVRRHASDAGYEAALALSDGRLRSGRTDFLAVPRLPVARGLSPEGLNLRLAGLRR